MEKKGSNEWWTVYSVTYFLSTASLWPLKQQAFLNQALKILLRQSWHWLLWGQHLTPSTQCILVCATVSSDKCWTNYCMPSFICLVTTLVCDTTCVQAAERGSMLKRRGREGGRASLQAQRPGVAWGKRCWKQGGRGLAGWGLGFTGEGARSREEVDSPQTLLQGGGKWLFGRIPHQLLQKSVLKGKGAQLMETATLILWPKAEEHATLKMPLCQRQQKDHRFG